MVRPEDYGIVATERVLKAMQGQSDAQNIRWLSNIAECGSWQLWDFSAEPLRIAGNIVTRNFSRSRRLHIARRWYSGSKLIGTLCSFQLNESYGYPVKSALNAKVCGHCLRAAESRGIEVGSKQPNIRSRR